MAERQKLEQAIAVLGEHRATLGNDVVDMAVVALREKLESLKYDPATGQHEQITVLVADLSGFTAMSELMDAEEVRDTINAVWEKLDSVIRAWGGKIDKHIGDGVIALFGVPTAHNDDPRRAVRAALDVQMELVLFNQNGQQETEARFNWQADMHMRIGIHTGPVLFGKVGTGGEYTAVGDTMNVAHQLERLAPIGDVLVSDDVYRHVHSFFDMRALEPVGLAGKVEPQYVHVVKREKPRSDRISMPGVDDVDARFFGRNAELEQLQHALQTTMDGGAARVVTIIGEAGVGKSRLLYEFEKWLGLLPAQVCLFDGRAQCGAGQAPYALMRDLFSSYHNVHARSSDAVGRERLAQGIIDVMKENEDRGREQAHFIGQLLGFDFSDSPYLQGIDGDARQVNDRIREFAFQDVARFFTAVASDYSAVVLFLEDLHWADEGAFDLIDHLVHACLEVPLLIVGAARPSLFKKWPLWQTMESLNPTVYTRLDMAPLSPIDSRHLAAEVLRNIPLVPLKLVEFVAEGAGGNPFRIEEIVRMLIRNGVIIKEARQWRVQMMKLGEMQVLPGLAGLFQTRLDSLSPVERETLQIAAVAGCVFWKTAVARISQSADKTITPDQIEAALQTLEEKGLCRRRCTTAFAGDQEYVFTVDGLQDVVYESIPSSQRRVFHAHVANWFIDRAGQQPSRYAGEIAGHFEQAGDTVQAAGWYGRAADLARDTAASETAIELYRQALRLLPDNMDSAVQQVALNEGLGQILQRRSRFEEAAGAFEAMRTAAHALGDHLTEARASHALFLTRSFQDNHAVALEHARQTETLARAAGSPERLAQALVAKGWALMCLNDISTALALSKEALATSTAAHAERETAYANALIGNLCRRLCQYDRAVQTTEIALAIFRKLGDRLWEGLMLSNLGHIARFRSDYARATVFYQDSLYVSRSIGHFYGVMVNLRELNKLAQYQVDYKQAQTYLLQALALAERSGNVKYRAEIAGELGELYLNWAVSPYLTGDEFDREEYLQQAGIWLEQALQLAQKSNRPLAQASIRARLARLLIEEDELAEALFQAKQSLDIARELAASRQSVAVGELLALAWHTLGLVAVRLPTRNLPVVVGEKGYDAGACFAQSLRVLTGVKGDFQLEKAQTLRAWARFELRHGEKERGVSLWREALSYFARLKMENEVAWMKRRGIA